MHLLQSHRAISTLANNNTPTHITHTLGNDDDTVFNDPRPPSPALTQNSIFRGRICAHRTDTVTPPSAAAAERTHPFPSFRLLSPLLSPPPASNSRPAAVRSSQLPQSYYARRPVTLHTKTRRRCCKQQQRRAKKSVHRRDHQFLVGFFALATTDRTAFPRLQHLPCQFHIGLRLSLYRP